MVAIKQFALRAFFILCLVFVLTETIVLLSYSNKNQFSATGAIASWLSHQFFNDDEQFIPNFVKRGDYYTQTRVMYWSDKIDLYHIEETYDLPKGLLHAVMHQESAGKLNAVSSAGAVGPFQFMAPTAKDYGLIVGKKDYRTDPKKSAIAAARYYQYLMVLFDNNLTYAVASYNAGQNRMLKANGEMEKMPDETQNYVKRVRSLMQLYQ